MDDNGIPQNLARTRGPLPFQCFDEIQPAKLDMLERLSIEKPRIDTLSGSPPSQAAFVRYPLAFLCKLNG